MRKFPASLTDGRRIDQWHDLFDLVDHCPVEQGFIAVLQSG